MKQIIACFLCVIGLTAVGDNTYVFSADRKNASVNPRRLPTTGRNFETGEVVSPLEGQALETLAKCGWYKVVLPNVEVGVLQYPVVTGYEFDATNGTATAIVEIRDGAPVKKYTQYKIIGALMQMGKWKEVKAFLVEKDLYDLFMGAQYLTNDDLNFLLAMKSMAALLGLNYWELEKVLEQCRDI